MIHSLNTNSNKIIIPNIRILIKGLFYLKNHSINKFFQKTVSVIERETRINNYNKSYKIYLKENKLTPQKLLEEIEIVKSLKLKPKISILMPTYNPPIKFFKKNIDSVINQIYQNWELCIADDNSTNKKVRKIILDYSKKDKRIKYIFREKNGHISQSTNSALDISTGEFVVLLDHDDILYPNSLSECVKIINNYTDIDLIYTDEDKIDTNNRRFEPHFKPDWSPETLLSGNYITHLACIRKKIIEKIGKFRVGYEGAQDLDLFLRISQITDKIYHIPKILYSWRTVKTSTASANSNAKSEYAYQNGVKAVIDFLKNKNLIAKVEIGEGRGLYRYIIENKNKQIDFFIVDTKIGNSTTHLIQKIKKTFPGSIIEISSSFKLGSKICNFIKKSKSNYIYFIDNNCSIKIKNIYSSIGYFKIDPIKIVTNKIINSKGKIYKTGLIITKSKNNIGLIDAFYGMTNGGYFNFNYSKMTKNFSATSLLGTIIDTNFFKKSNLAPIKKLKSLKDIGVYLSYLCKIAKQRIVYNPNLPIIYKSKFTTEITTSDTSNFILEILNNSNFDPNYNPNLSIKNSKFNIKT